VGKFLLHAPNVHLGGGLSLLQAILDVEPIPFDLAQLDARVQSELRMPAGMRVNFVNRSLPSRLRAEWQLRRECAEESLVLCFNNLPPLFGVDGKAIVFVQNRLLVEPSMPKDYPAFARLRIALERLWLRGCSDKAARYFVQSQSMAVLLRSCIGPGRPISVMPFAGSQPDSLVDAPRTGRRFDFIYAASGDPHKNHGTLLNAWRILKQTGLRPSLCLTIDPTRYPDLALAIHDAVCEYELDITNLGWLSASSLAEIYARSDALIYPSLTESFGLPLLEAEQARLAILAPERDYVRDVAKPVQTFDPNSSLSIARAVRRHLKFPEEGVALSDASNFLAEIQS